MAVGVGGIGLSERIGTILIVRESLARFRRAIRPLALLWLVAGAVLGGMEAALLALGFDTAAQTFTPAAVAYNLALAVLTGVFSAVGVRLLLGAPGSWRRVDRSFFLGGGLFAAFTFAFGAWTLALGEMLARPSVPLLGIALGVAAIAMSYVLVKLSLWPAASVMARPNVTAARSWRLMRQSTRGYILAHLIFLTPMAGIVIAAAPVDGVPFAEGLLEAVFVGFSILSLAATATVYDLRVERPSSVADVFA